jgi:chemotaxis signal transduction protein
VRPDRLPQPKGAREDVILFTIAGFKFAIAAHAVSEIRGLEDLRPFSLGDGYARLAKIEFTLDRNGVSYFVVDGARHFHQPASKPARVMILRHAAVGVMVDSTDRMTQISVLHALPLAFGGDERNWYRGLAVINGEVLPVVNQMAFVSKAESLVLRNMTEQIRGAAAAV